MSVAQDIGLPLVAAGVGYFGAGLRFASDRQRVAVERQRLQDERDRLTDARAEKELKLRVDAYKVMLDAERDIDHVRFGVVGLGRIEYTNALGALERAVDTVMLLANDDVVVAAGALTMLHRNEAPREETQKAVEAFIRAARHDAGVGPALGSTTASVQPAP